MIGPPDNLARYTPCLWRAVYRVTRNAPQEKEDAFAVSLMATLKARCEGADPRLVYRIAYCASANYLRSYLPDVRSASQQKYGCLDSFDCRDYRAANSGRLRWDGGMAGADERLILGAALSLLTDQERRILRMIYAEGKEEREIALAEDIARSTVGNYHRAALRKLRCIFADRPAAAPAPKERALRRRGPAWTEEERAAQSARLKAIWRERNRVRLDG